MRSKDLSYIAGFIDADGCIALFKNKNAYRPSIEVAQTQLPILKWLQKAIGFGRIYKRLGKGRNNDAYILTLFPNECRKFLPIILPYLKVKHKQAVLVLEYFNIVDGTYHRDSAKRAKFTRIKGKMNKFNKRGRQ